MRQPLVTLTTDFGNSDHYVGVMKGVILAIAPRARIVDITHEIPAFDIAGAAFLLAEAHSHFPAKTIHVAVVDPGVGSSRRPILAEMAGQFFIAPDNGVLSLIAAREKHKVRHISNEAFFRHPVSRTFHGRDIFAPVAAHLAAGIPPARFGKLIHDHCQLASLAPVRTGKRAWTGMVMRVDRFGNLITNFHIGEFEAVKTRPFELLVGLERVTRLALNFAEGAPGELLAIAGSSGYLEVAANRDSAARKLGCGAGAPAELALY